MANYSETFNNIYAASLTGSTITIGAQISGTETVTDTSQTVSPKSGNDTTLSLSGAVPSANPTDLQGTITDSSGTVIGYVFSVKGSLYVVTNASLTTNSTYTLNTLGTLTLCFLAGTMIATPTGEVAVETLQAGDLVLTLDGRAQPILWLGRQTKSARFADPLRTYPIRIKANALAEGVPARDLLISPDHALLVDGILVHAGALVNGMTITRELEMPEQFTYYHVELADHALILAEGAPAETFIDNIDRMAFDNWAERGAVAEAIPEMAYPRAKSARQVPARIKQRLAALAAELAETAAAA